MRYKPYPKYKESGVAWLGEVPEGWEISKLRFIFSFNKGLTITKANLKNKGIPCVNYGEIHSKYGFEVSSEKHELKCVDSEYLITSKSSLLSKGDFVFADTSEDIEGAGNFTHLSGETQVFAGYHTIIGRQINEHNFRFLAYLIDSEAFRTQVRLSVKGVKVFSITQVILKNCIVWLPKIEEQKKIATYLDQKTQKIDTLIEKQQTLIKLLKEKRQALVDKALNESDIKNVTLKQLIERIYRPVYRDKNETYITLGLYNRGRGLFHREPKEEDELGESDFYWVEDGDLIISGQFAWEGAIALAKKSENGCIVSHRFPIVRGKEGILNTEYLWAFFTTQLGDFVLNEHSVGSAGRNRPLNMNTLIKEKIPLPSMEAQLKVAKVVQIEQQIHIKIKREIELLKERRTALISAVVTGKVDVRNDDRGEENEL